jgi:hypothetical protein
MLQLDCVSASLKSFILKKCSLLLLLLWSYRRYPRYRRLFALMLSRKSAVLMARRTRTTAKLGLLALKSDSKENVQKSHVNVPTFTSPSAAKIRKVKK